MRVREFVESMKQFARLSVQQPGKAGAVSSRRECVVSEPGAVITITAISLTPEEKRRLCTGGARIPPTSQADRLYTRSECDALIEAERARMLATLSEEAQAVLEVFANASPDDTCGSLTARTESCSYWAQELAKKLVRP